MGTPDDCSERTARNGEESMKECEACEGDVKTAPEVRKERLDAQWAELESWCAQANAVMLNANAPPIEPAPQGIGSNERVQFIISKDGRSCHLDIDREAEPKTEPAPPLHVGEYREHAIVTGIDWTHNLVTLQLRLPIALDELPSVDDEVEVSWPGKVGE